ncbi:hypothetical protein GCM10010211_25950 [Streptomyces albospinus]|uniref:Uncharacterized protein n=1 Tax=Streptomyces albospinus TaxID=285515 RepID=A0ABQ2UY42_9ACTN|nr:hypothetical protein GCM10010211_25950 [Streptomyces albospinus]
MSVIGSATPVPQPAPEESSRPTSLGLISYPDLSTARHAIQPASLKERLTRRHWLNEPSGPVGRVTLCESITVVSGARVHSRMRGSASPCAAGGRRARRELVLRPLTEREEPKGRNGLEHSDRGVRQGLVASRPRSVIHGPAHLPLPLIQTRAQCYRSQATEVERQAAR